MKVITPFGIGKIKELTEETHQRVHLEDGIKIISRESIFPFSNFGVIRIIDLGIRTFWGSGYIFNLFFEYSLLESEIVYKHNRPPLNELRLIMNLKNGNFKIISSGNRENIFDSLKLDKITIIPRIDSWEESKILETSKLRGEILKLMMPKPGIYGRADLSIKGRKIINFSILSLEKDDYPLFYKNFHNI